MNQTKDPFAHEVSPIRAVWEPPYPWRLPLKRCRIRAAELNLGFFM